MEPFNFQNAAVEDAIESERRSSREKLLPLCCYGEENEACPKEWLVNEIRNIVEDFGSAN